MYRDIAFIWTKFVPLDRDCKNNSKLLTSRDPGIPGSYKQGLKGTVTICNLSHKLQEKYARIQASQDHDKHPETAHELYTLSAIVYFDCMEPASPFEKCSSLLIILCRLCLDINNKGQSEKTTVDKK